MLPSWTLILPESWDESKTYFKGEVGHDQCTSEVRVKKTPALQASLSFILTEFELFLLF